MSYVVEFFKIELYFNAMGYVKKPNNIRWIAAFLLDFVSVLLHFLSSLRTYCILLFIVVS